MTPAWLICSTSESDRPKPARHPSHRRRRLCRALRSRIGLFETVVGRLQPILAELPQAITRAVLPAAARQRESSADVVAAIERRASEAQTGAGFDIDAVVTDDLIIPERPRSPVTMDDLDRVISDPDLLRQGTETQPLGHRTANTGCSRPA